MNRNRNNNQLQTVQRGLVLNPNQLTNLFQNLSLVSPNRDGNNPRRRQRQNNRRLFYQQTQFPRRRGRQQFPRRNIVPRWRRQNRTTVPRVLRNQNISDINGLMTFSGSDIIRITVKDAETVYNKIPLNPWLLSSLKPFANMYTNFRFLAVTYQYIGEAPSTTESVVTLGFSETIMDVPNHLSSFQTFRNYFSGNAFKTSPVINALDGRHTSERYEMGNDEVGGTREYRTQGCIYHLGHNGTAGALLGQLHIKYTIQLENRRFDSKILYSQPDGSDDNSLPYDVQDINSD